MVSSKGRRVLKLGVTAALAYAILAISEVTDSLQEFNQVHDRRVLTLDDKKGRRRERASLRKTKRAKSKSPNRNDWKIKEEEPLMAEALKENSRDMVELPPHNSESPAHPIPHEPIDKTAELLKLIEKAVQAEKNRLVMNELAKRSRATRSRTGIHPGPIFHQAELVKLIGVESLRLAEDKPKILNDGTYLIFQNWKFLLFHDQFIKPNMCWTLITEPQKIKRVHYHGGKCKDFDNQFGNRLGWVYGMKMIANAARIPFYFTCDISHGETPNGAAFLMSLNPRDEEIGPMPKGINGSDLSLKDVCRPCGNTFCGWNGDSTYMASDAMISDWKQLAAPSADSVQDNDDAVIHLRLGDAMYARSGISEDKGLFPHGTYIKLLKQAEEERGEFASIGIVTAPFKGKFVRANYDLGSTSTSAVIAADLVNALQAAFPKAVIRIHNSPDETIIGALARIVNARKVAICGCSTFCPYPLLATKGIGYMFGPASTRHHQNDWIYNAANRYENFRLFETPMLNGLVINNWITGEKLNTDHILEWVRNQDPEAGNVDIMEQPIFRFNHIHPSQ